MVARLREMAQSAWRSSLDRNWNEIPCVFGAVNAPYTIPPPAQLGTMVSLAEEIGKDFSYVGVDFCGIDGRAIFGEITFYPGGGLDVVEPKEYGAFFGQQWVMGMAGAKLPACNPSPLQIVKAM